ncbi:uncharacterized protein RHO17_026181 [Thomomys bottae]
MRFFKPNLLVVSSPCRIRPVGDAWCLSVPQAGAPGVPRRRSTAGDPPPAFALPSLPVTCGRRRRGPEACCCSFSSPPGCGGGGGGGPGGGGGARAGLPLLPREAQGPYLGPPRLGPGAAGGWGMAAQPAGVPVRRKEPGFLVWFLQRCLKLQHPSSTLRESNTKEDGNID